MQNIQCLTKLNVHRAVIVQLQCQAESKPEGKAQVSRV